MGSMSGLSSMPSLIADRSASTPCCRAYASPIFFAYSSAAARSSACCWLTIASLSHTQTSQLILMKIWKSLRKSRMCTTLNAKKPADASK